MSKQPNVEFHTPSGWRITVTLCNYLVNASKMIQCNAMANRNLLNILVLSLKSSTGSQFLVIFF